MIFLTIGAQEPFDRLVKMVDELAPQLSLPVVAQVSRTGYQVKNMQAFEFLSPAEFESYFQKATLLISHAGMGTIISALVNAKPMVVMPRLGKFGETRNDHQVATAERFGKMGYVQVANTEEELKANVMGIINANSSPANHQIGNFASIGLISSLQEYILPHNMR